MPVNVLIVEDERILRQGIVSLIDWSSLDCQIVDSCENPLIALKILESQPIDLIITDIRMPHMDGLTFAQEISTTHPEIGVIILSAYNDFTYAQKAIRAKVLYYVLKSNFIQELPSVVCSCVKEIQKKKTDSLSNNNLFDLSNLKTILSGDTIDCNYVNDFLKHQQIHLANYYIVLHEIVLEDVEFNTIEKQQNKKHDFIQPIINFIDLTFQNEEHLTVLLNHNIIATLINYQSCDFDLYNKKLFLLCNKLISTVQEYMSFDINICISSLFHNSKDLPVAYNEAKKTLESNYTSMCVSFYDATINDSNNESINILKLSYTLYQLLITNQLDELRQTCENLFEGFKRDHLSSTFVRYNLSNLISSCMMQLNNNYVKVTDGSIIQHNFIQRLFETNSNYSLQKLLISTLLLISENIIIEKTALSNLVMETNAYIQHHYKDNLRLEDIASFTNVSASYLSRSYKLETGISITTYINKFRINKAKELFHSGNTYISTVAYEVGYQDPTYFTKVFTKQEGMNPKTYCNLL